MAHGVRVAVLHDDQARDRAVRIARVLDRIEDGFDGHLAIGGLGDRAQTRTDDDRVVGRFVVEDVRLRW